MRLNQEGARLSGSTLDKVKAITAKLAIAATVTISDDFPQAIDFDPGTTSQKLLMPVVSSANEGRIYFFNNLGTVAGTLVLRDSGDTTTYATIPVSKMAMVINLNGTWRALISA